MVAQFEMITGEHISLFLDRDELHWGDDWHGKIDASLASVAFFIPVITPRYFQSIECRRELNYFVRRADTLGLGELIMPIKYIDFPALENNPTGNEAIELVRRFQWEDWTELRFCATDSPEYRRAVSRMASRLAAANASADQTQVPVELLESTDMDDGPGILDSMAGMEAALPEWQEALESIGRGVQSVGELFTAATPEMEGANKSNKPLAARLTVARKLASDLRDPASEIANSGESFTKRLNEVDQGLAIMIERTPAEAAEYPDRVAQACRLFESIKQMAISYEKALEGLESMLEATQSIETMSRDLRAPLKTMKRGLLSMQEGRRVIQGWVSQIDDSSLDCSV
ncbi:toll/interleukin-1 receptor domain-containing protein [Brachybacterium sp. sponge]|uniref:toll/interleukin-1 receptor domain-containing protein n=1 Tax=Brachybacterium sp. sponge TaxID=1775432 RepID=UPI0007A55CB2|nr:toll/interleukin-1 receptor domain-containing protein [Brachybacterium sp. sponge]